MKLKEVAQLFFTFFGILSIDMVSKGLTHSYLVPFEVASPFFPFGGIAVFQWKGIDFCIHHVTNKGVAWGLGGGLQDWILVARICIIGALIVYLYKSPKAYLQKFPLALIIAGGVGNILDYFLYGHVVDMFHFIFWGYSYPVFNVADSAICLGIIFLLWKSWTISRCSIPNESCSR